MKKLILFTFIFALTFSLNAQTADDPWWINIEYGNNKLDFRSFEGMFDFGNFETSAIRVGMDRYINPSFDLELGLSYGNLIYETIWNSQLFDFDLRAVYKLANGYLLKEESKLAPFVFVGIGASSFRNIEPYYQEYEDGLYGNMPLGLGLEFKATEGASIVGKMTYNKSISNAPNYMQYNLGVSFSIRSKKDSDGDGVYDRNDNCPNEVGPAENNGCPWPDQDNDGVYDKDDQCPNEAGSAEMNGCPDADGDGIKDSEDQCPNEAGSAEMDGCPDADGDGIKDSEDQCPNEAGSAEMRGCPDRDGDGIKDSEDACPDEAGVAENRGCPVIEEEVKQVITNAVERVQFNSGSDVLRNSSLSALDQLAAVLVANKAYKVKLSGYTDNTGNPDSNLKLSKERAAAVKKYLVDNGVEASRITSEGYGIANPIADNSTREGRAKNRRVNIEIEF